MIPPNPGLFIPRPPPSPSNPFPLHATALPTTKPLRAPEACVRTNHHLASTDSNKHRERRRPSLVLGKMAPLHLHRWLLVATAALSSFSTGAATNATVRWMPDLPEWQSRAVMRLQLTAPSAEAAPLTYDVYPLASLLANGTQTTRNVSRLSLSDHVCC